MAVSTSVTAGTTESSDNDLLFYFPYSTVSEYAKGQIIYGPEHPCTYFYVIIAGVIAISRTNERGHAVIVNVVRTDEFFGESALGAMPRRCEQAVALEKTLVMSWPRLKVEELIEKRPKLGLALLKVLVQREVEFAERIESISLESIAVRLGRSLIRLSNRLGTSGQNGKVRMRAFTHEFLAQYIGTSRELVATWMSQFRRDGLLTYSRQEISIHPENMREWLRQNR